MDAEPVEQLLVRAEAAIANADFSSALPLLDAAERAGAEPDRCAGNRWFAYVQTGDLLAAWRESDAIRRRGAPDPHRFWHGEDLRGKRVILRSLHGFGDAVQMFRFLPRLAERAAHLIVEVPPRLVELAPCFNGVGEVITWGEGAPKVPPAWDVQIEVMELPYLLRVSTADLQPTHGYLRLPQELQTRVGRAIGRKTKPRVGVVWTAGEWNPTRSVPAEVIRTLGAADDVEFWSLQSRRDRPEDLLRELGWHDVYACGDGILALAGAIAHMDLVITVDTLAAHLAGALNVPCWLLLQEPADWRWMSGRTDSPWYPSLQLWRQARGGGWGELCGRVLGALQGWAAAQAGDTGELLA